MPPDILNVENLPMTSLMFANGPSAHAYRRLNFSTVDTGTKLSISCYIYSSVKLLHRIVAISISGRCTTTRRDARR
jgi:hypothetical protein